MKFIVSSSVLLKNLQSISGVLSTSNTLPILENFLFNLGENSLNITASDLETTMTVNVPVVKADEPGMIAIQAKLLLDILKTFGDIPLTFTINEDTLSVEISAGEGKYKLNAFKGDEFPKIPTMEDGTSLEINSITLANAINKTIFATGNDELRPVMSGVFCQISDEDITFVATDAHKLVRYRRTDTKSTEAAAFILPKKPLNQLRSQLSSQDVAVKVEYNTVNAFFSFSNINLVCRLIDGKYPNYEAVIPTNNTKKLFVDRVLLLNTLKRIALFANQSTRQIRFKISGQELVLSAEDIDLANEAKERLTCTFEGEDIEIGFNSKFILEMMNNLDTEEICIEMSASNRAALLLPVNSENKEEDILMLVMPVMLNQ
ncbi:MAG: DNA polymerase III subunit beta [Bacteroidota bacterium]